MNLGIVQRVEKGIMLGAGSPNLVLINKYNILKLTLSYLGQKQQYSETAENDE